MIVGELLGRQLELVPAPLGPFAQFQARQSAGKVLVPIDPVMRPHGSDLYVDCDTSKSPCLYPGEMLDGIEPMARVVLALSDVPL